MSTRNIGDCGKGCTLWKRTRLPVFISTNQQIAWNAASSASLEVIAIGIPSTNVCTQMSKKLRRKRVYLLGTERYPWKSILSNVQSSVGRPPNVHLQLLAVAVETAINPLSLLSTMLLWLPFPPGANDPPMVLSPVFEPPWSATRDTCFAIATMVLLRNIGVGSPRSIGRYSVSMAR